MKLVSAKNILSLVLFVAVAMVTLFAVPSALAAEHSFGASSQKAPLVGTDRPAEFDGIGITEKLGDKLDLSLQFLDENGQTVTLGKYFDGKLPVSISMIYYACPGLCNFHFNGVIDSLKTVDWSAGDKYQVLAISFDAKETPDLALKKRASYLKVYDRPGTDKGFHFLTANQTTIDQLTKQLGFKFKWNEEAKEWAHASAAVIATPNGTIARYLHGILFDGPTYKLALNEAGEGKVGSFVDKMIWYCFKYDPHQSKYVLYAYRAMQVGAVAIMLVLAMILLPVWFRGRLLR